MFAQSLRRLQDALNQRADYFQREFIAVSEDLKAVGRRLLEADPAARAALLAEQAALQDRQHALADAVNLWRDRARASVRQPNDEAVRAFLAEMEREDDSAVRAAAARALFVLDAPEEELEKLSRQALPARSGAISAAGRLIQRAQTEFDLRQLAAGPRKAAAVEFVNRPGMLRDEAALAELEAALEHPDPLVREVVTQTVIQFHRLRAMRLAELDQAHASVKRLRQINDPAVVPVFVEILSRPRKGFVPGPAGPLEADNARSRRVALGGLVEWHTPEARAAVVQCQFDRDPQIVKLAAVALELFPGDWNGPTPETRKAPPEKTPAH